ncbi:hypothetical protein MKX03_017239 [Papaver bracteatum]|nr:hypothetical protein MKX03_017239 [Papaver bracteatum]
MENTKMRLPTLSESSRSPKIRKPTVSETSRSPKIIKTTTNSLLKSNVPKRKRSGSDMLLNSKQRKVSESPTDAQRSGLGEGTPCKLFTDFDEVEAGNVFDSTPGEKVHIVKLGEDKLRVQVLTSKDLQALVPVPVEDEIVTVKDALGGFLAWPKRLIVIEKEGENRTSSSDFLEKFLQQATCHLKKLGGGVYATIEANVFRTETKESVYITEGDIESICKKELRASVTDVVIYIRYLHQKVLSARNQNKFAFMDPTAITASASSSPKLTRDLTAKMDKTNAELVFVYPMVWWLDSQGVQQDKDIDKIMRRVVEGCLKKRRSSGSNVFGFPQHIPQHKNNWESGFYTMRFMKEIIEGKLKLNSTVMRKSEYEEGDIMEVRREWVNHVLPLLVT